MGRKNKEVKMAKIRKCNESQSIGTTIGLTLKGICTRSMARVDGPISKLNDDCLREIFSYLTKRQLIGIERVCKKWKEVSLRLWSTKTSLDYQNISEITLESFAFNICHFKCILIRCGKHLKSLDLNHDNLLHLDKSQAKALISYICQYCKNLKHLSLKGDLITKKGFSTLEKKIAPNLESFQISACNDLNDENLLRLLKKAPKLNGLGIIGNSQISGDSLVKSEKAFKELYISHCYGISDVDAYKVLDNSPNLEILDGPAYFTFESLNGRPLREHLTKLALFESNFFRVVPPDVQPFSNLRFLNLHNDRSINNDILSKFYKWFPNLEALELPECEYTRGDGKQLNNEGIKELVKLPKLKSLNLYSSPWLTSDTLVNLAVNTNGRFEVLECSKCPQLYDSGMTKFVSLCPSLKFLDLSNCKNITDEFLAGVLNYMPLRHSKEPLKIKITSSDICDVDKYKKKHPLLVLEQFGHLESDNEDDDDSTSSSDDDDDSSDFDNFSNGSSDIAAIEDILVGPGLSDSDASSDSDDDDDTDSSEMDDFFFI